MGLKVIELLVHFKRIKAYQVYYR